MAHTVRFHPALESLLVPIDSVEQYPGNPRNGDIDAIAESIQINGFVAPVIVQRSTGFIVAGNHRYAALLSLDEESIPVVFVDMTDAEAKRYLLADNRTSDLGRYDDTALMELLGQMNEEFGSLVGTGYTDADMAALARQVEHDLAPLSLGDRTYSLVIDCENERQQADLMHRLEREHLRVRLLIT